MVTRTNCQALIETYLRKFEASESQGKCLFVTPFDRPDGELIEVEMARRQDGHLLLSDMGTSLGYLHINGLSTTRTLLDDVRRTCQRYGVSLTNYELVADVVDSSSAGDSLHALIRTIQTVSDFIQRRRPVERLRFDDEVEAYLIGHKKNYDNDYEVDGADMKHRVRFHVNSGARALIQPLSAASEAVAFAWAERWAYHFNDIKRRDSLWNLLAILDDRRERSQFWTPRTRIPLESVAKVVPWSENPHLLELLETPSSF